MILSDVQNAIAAFKVRCRKRGMQLCVLHLCDVYAMPCAACGPVCMEEDTGARLPAGRGSH